MPTIYNKVVIDGSTLMDISDTTAVASDVVSGKYFYTANGIKTAGTASGGGSSEDQTVTGTVTGGGDWVTVLDDNVTVWDDSTIIEDLVDMELTNGDTYRTTIDGTAYISEAQLHPQWGAVYFGNVNIWDEVDDGTGLPFCAYKTTYGLKFMLRDGGNSTHAIKIERQVTS